MSKTEVCEAQEVDSFSRDRGDHLDAAIAENKKRPKRHKYQWRAFLWLAIPLAFLLVFSYYPPIKAFFDSFTDSRFNSATKGYETVFVGVPNYVELLQDPVFWVCVKNVVIFTLFGMVFGNLMTIFLAELLYNLKSKKLSAFFRVLFIVPILVPSLVILLIWKYVMFGSTGLMNNIVTAMGGEPQLWYWSSVDVVGKFAILFTNFPWVAGTSFLIYLAGLQGISNSVVEAAKLDHCSVWKRIWKIDLPLILPQLKYFLVMGVIGGFQNFDLQLIVVGAETDATNVLGLYLYDRAFGTGYVAPEGTLIRSRFGYASAVGMIILLITLVLTVLNMSLNREKKPKKAKAGKETKA